MGEDFKGSEGVASWQGDPCTPGVAYDACRKRIGIGNVGVLVLLAFAGCNNAAVDLSVTERLKATERSDLAWRAKDLLLRAADSGVDVLASNAIEALVEVAPQEGLAAFRNALRSPSAMIRFAGCVALGELRDTAWLNQIMEHLRDPDPRVRLAAAFASYRCGETRQAQVLVDALEHQSDENLRSDAAYLIGRLRDPRALPRLRRAVDDPSNRVRVHVYTAMATLGDEEALRQLIQYAQGDVVSRMIALQSLAQLAKEETREALRYRLHASEEYLQARLIASRGEGKLGSKEGYALALQAASQTESDPNEQARIRSLAALALGAIGDPRALATLRKLAADQGDSRIQVAASYAILQILKSSRTR